MSGPAPIDRGRIEAICRGNDSLAIELIGMLVDEAVPIVAELDERVRGRCGEIQVNQLAHALKGIAGSVGASELCAAATRLEIAAAQKPLPESTTLGLEMTAVACALEQVCLTQRSWIASAAGQRRIFAA